MESLSRHVQQLIDAPPAAGAVKAAFDAVLNPFEVNRRVVRGAQAWFERHGLPWKGHCPGILGGIQSRLDLNDVTAEQCHRGRAPIYNNTEAVRQYVGFHANIALRQGRQDLAAPLVAELKLLARL